MFTLFDSQVHAIVRTVLVRMSNTQNMNTMNRIFLWWNYIDRTGQGSEGVFTAKNNRRETRPVTTETRVCSGSVEFEHFTIHVMNTLSESRSFSNGLPLSLLASTRRRCSWRPRGIHIRCVDHYRTDLWQNSSRVNQLPREDLGESTCWLSDVSSSAHLLAFSNSCVMKWLHESCTPYKPDSTGGGQGAWTLLSYVMK